MHHFWAAFVLTFYILVIGAINYAIMCHIGNFFKFSEHLEELYHWIKPKIKKLIKK